MHGDHWPAVPHELVGLAVMCVAVLLGAGADVNARDKDLNTPLRIAAKASHTQLATVLLVGGADVSLRNRAGHKAASFACSLDTVAQSARAEGGGDGVDGSVGGVRGCE